MSEPTFIYRDQTPGTAYTPSPVTLTGLDAVMPANASERTAPRRTVVVERSLLVGLLDAWQGYVEDVGVDNADEVLAEIMGDIAEVIA